MVWAWKITSGPIPNHLQAVVMGPSQKFLTLVGWGQFFVARVGSAIFGLVLGLENFP